MAEDLDIDLPEAEAASTGDVALAAALDEARANPDLSPPVRALFEAQAKLVDDQRHHLAEQLRVVRLDKWSKRLKLLLQAITILIGAAILTGFGALVWSAHADQGVRIEAFSVPPDLAQRGITGKVVASKLLDDLAEMQTVTDNESSRPRRSYANNWNDNLKVEIPETGVSIDQIQDLLVRWLGHQTRIDREVYETPEGVVVAARSGAEPAEEHTGPEADLDGLVHKAAEDIYRATQPYRYAIFLLGEDRTQEGTALLERLSKTGPAEERMWAWATLAQRGDLRAAVIALRKAIALNPNEYLFHMQEAYDDNNLGHPEAAVAAMSQALVHMKRGERGDLTARQAEAEERRFAGHVAHWRGDYGTALSDFRAVQAAGAPISAKQQFTAFYTGLHQLTAARDAWIQEVDSGSGASQGSADRNAIIVQAGLDLATEDWPDLASLTDKARAVAQKQPEVDQAFQALAYPLIAYAKARLGDMAGAQALIATTPLDSDDALRMRGRIAAVARDWPAVDRWFEAATRQSPSIPFAYLDWGQALLAKGDLDGAIAKAQQAHRLTPHFADPLELWGEALMAKGDFAVAASKFAEGAKYAPSWGRLHLKWAEALARAGKADEARSHRQMAATLDLTAAERAELNGLRV
jgi:tetratricopeptide (TPR) repeat protein